MHAQRRGRPSAPVSAARSSLRCGRVVGSTHASLAADVRIRGYAGIALVVPVRTASSFDGRPHCDQKFHVAVPIADPWCWPIAALYTLEKRHSDGLGICRAYRVCLTYSDAQFRNGFRIEPRTAFDIRMSDTAGYSSARSTPLRACAQRQHEHGSFAITSIFPQGAEPMPKPRDGQCLRHRIAPSGIANGWTGWLRFIFESRQRNLRYASATKPECECARRAGNCGWSR